MFDSIGTWKRRSALRTLAVLSVISTLSACMMFAQPPRDLDYSRTRTSAAGLYRGSIQPEGGIIPQGKLQAWTLHLETVNGEAVDSARITVDGGMPQHGHGLPTKPRVTASLGGGDYMVEGLKFNMGGWWVVTFRVRASAGEDSVVFNLSL